MKRLMLSLVALGLMVAARPAFADAGSDRTHLYVTADYYLSSGIENDISDNLDKAIASVNNTSGDTTVSNGYGGRVGFIKPFAGNKLELGATVGYIKGPEIETTFDDQSGVTTGKIDSDITTRFLRVLVEGAGRIYFSEKAYIRLGAGAGVAQSHVNNDVTSSGFYAGALGGSKSETGFSWEVSPAIVFLVGSTGIELGFRYTELPKISKTTTTPEIDWKPYGFYLGLTF